MVKTNELYVKVYKHICLIQWTLFKPWQSNNAIIFFSNQSLLIDELTKYVGFVTVNEWLLLKSIE